MEDQKQLIKQIESKEKTIELLNSTIIKLKEKIIIGYSELMENYKKLVLELDKSNYKSISKDIKLEAKLKFNERRFNDYFLKTIDRRVNLYKSFKFFNESNNFVYNNDHINNIRLLLERLLEENNDIIKLRDNKERKDSINRLLDDYFFIEYDLTHNGDRLMYMSPGKRGLVLLQLILHLSNAKHPILIDQPEDNLDNRTISTDLINYIISKKDERQIIMVTHNANLTVLTDAEEVIVANQDGQNGRDNKEYKFEYISGALENSFNSGESKGILYQKGIKQHVCEILEGGAEAFEKRERKYDLRRENSLCNHF